MSGFPKWLKQPDRDCMGAGMAMMIGCLLSGMTIIWGTFARYAFILVGLEEAASWLKQRERLAPHSTSFGPGLAWPPDPAQNNSVLPSGRYPGEEVFHAGTPGVSVTGHFPGKQVDLPRRG